MLKIKHCTSGVTSAVTKFMERDEELDSHVVSPLVESIVALDKILIEVEVIDDLKRIFSSSPSGGSTTVPETGIREAFIQLAELFQDGNIMLCSLVHGVLKKVVNL